ncbi:MAG: CAP domain-containing protein [Patescibacteria group bacterium]
MGFWPRLRNHFVPHPTNAYRPHLLRRGWMVFFLAFVLATEGFLVASLVARQSGGSFLASIIASELISFTNEARAAQNDGQLVENKLLAAAAQKKAEDMAEGGYFAHQSPDGKQPWDFITAAGYDYQYAGENLAVRFVDSKDVVNAWMASPTHRANIVKAAYRETGIGIAQGIYKGSSATYVVQYFGARAPAGGVLGAEVSPPVKVSPSPVDTVARQALQLVSNPRSSTAWIFGGIATLLLVLLAFAFFFHLQVQATGLLLPGTVVAGIALFFLLFNASLLPAGPNQTASALFAGELTTVIDDAAASTP